MGPAPKDRSMCHPDCWTHSCSMQFSISTPPSIMNEDRWPRVVLGGPHLGMPVANHSHQRRQTARAESLKKA